MKLRTLIGVVTIGLVLAACSSVYSPQPLGEKPLKLDDSWTGNWRTEDSIFSTAVVDGEAGLLQIASIVPKSGGIEIETFQGYVRTHGELVLLSVKDKESEHGYHWFLIDSDAEQVLIAWLPDAAAFKAAITAGTIPGSLVNAEDKDSDDVVLGELNSGHYQMIADPATGLIDWKQPSVLIRVSD